MSSARSEVPQCPSLPVSESHPTQFRFKSALWLGTDLVQAGSERINQTVLTEERLGEAFCTFSPHLRATGSRQIGYKLQHISLAGSSETPEPKRCAAGF
ncbi:hypothetical protein AAFF_G00057230 [Aldrovandia affinis]|uniref:Uncharacterized protein n=1 Tax=Aldrovandia affinis TaxID=143900 RepID=A0AAD7WEF8_9TELE|nr:hypothetical protein AAFF_G00057230 [Aldrovandia affinis]